MAITTGTAPLARVIASNGSEEVRHILLGVHQLVSGVISTATTLPRWPALRQRLTTTVGAESA
jgi:hypothetical protein